MLTEVWLERMVSFDDEAEPLRQGAWTSEEYEYVNAIVDAFHNGLLVVDKGTKLRSFLARCVHCGVKRISKKMENSDYHGRGSYLKKWNLSDSDIKDTEHMLLDLKSKFEKSVQQNMIKTDNTKAKESPPSVGLKTAAVSSKVTSDECMPTALLTLSNLGPRNPEASPSSMFNGTLNWNTNLSASASQQLSACESANSDIQMALLAASKRQAIQLRANHQDLVSTKQANEDIRRKGAQLLETLRSGGSRDRSLYQLALRTHAPNVAHRAAAQAHAAGFTSIVGAMPQNCLAPAGTSPAALAAYQGAVGHPCTQVKSASLCAWSLLQEIQLARGSLSAPIPHSVATAVNQPTLAARASAVDFCSVPAPSALASFGISDQTLLLKMLQRTVAATPNSSSVNTTAKPSASLPDALAAARNKQCHPFIAAEEAANKRCRFH
jgi:hypothetical protein